MRDSNSCPDCEEIMEDGFIVGGAQIWWTKKIPKLALTKKDGNIQLARSFVSFANIKGRRCPKCKLIVLKQ